MRIGRRQFPVGDRRLQFVRGELLERGGERLRSARRHDRADGNRTRAAGAVSAGDAIGVALHHFHPFQGNVEILRNDLRIGRLVPLPVRLRADQQREIAVLIEREGAFFPLAPRGAFDIARHAEPANEPALSRFLSARAEARDVGFGEAGAHRALEVADVVIAVGLGAVGHLGRLDEIARANLLGGQTQRARAAIDQPLQHVGRLGPSGAAIGVDGNGVRVDAAHARVQRFDAVGARRHRRAEPGDVRSELREIGPEIAEDIDPQSEKPALAVERHFSGGDVVAALRIADEMLGTVGLPAHGAPQPPRRLKSADIRDR